MTTNISRRDFIRGAGAGFALGPLLFGVSRARAGGGDVVVIGGGFGGATAAKYIRLIDPSIQVTLIEPAKTYVTCPGSNWVLGGLRKIDQITMTYDGLERHGVKVVHDMVTHVDPDKRSVKLKSGGTLSYDRLVVSPGIDFKWGKGYTAAVSHEIPHAWKAGAQTTLLRKQLEAMPDGGTFIIVPPNNPFRCPPGPAERISMVAHYFKKHKPKSKIIALDPKGKFSKQGLFIEGWKKLYGYGTDASMIDYHQNVEIEEIDPKTKTVVTGVDEYKADVLNFIPDQKAGAIAHATGLTGDGDWCPIDGRTFESTLIKGIHVIGDASIAKPLPKSGYAANSEAKVCAAAIAALLQDRPVPEPSWVNTCYSLVAHDYGISVAMVYEIDHATGKISKVQGAGGLSPADAPPKFRRNEALYAQSWWMTITADTWG
ncbi:MAG TPA: cytochrome C [Thiotrichales bacterium]|nr:cytochrome C [Thiotrichales bacterium]